MLPWVREKFAESRLRWQNRKQQQQQQQQRTEHNHQHPSSPPALPSPTFIEPTSANAATEPTPNLQSESAPSSPMVNPMATTVRNVLHQTVAPARMSLTSTRQPNQSDSILPHVKENPFRNHRQRCQSNENIVRRLHPGTETNTFDASSNYDYNHHEHDRNWLRNSYIASTSLLAHKPYQLTVPHVNLKILICSGAKCTLCVPLTLTGNDVKYEAIAEFHAKHQLLLPTNGGSSASEPKFFPSNCDTNNLDLIELSRLYKLTRISKLHIHFDETVSLATANVQNNEEMLLIRRSGLSATTLTSTSSASLSSSSSATSAGTVTAVESNETTSNFRLLEHFLSGDSSDAEEDANGPTQQDIELATANMESQHFRTLTIVNIDELVLQSDVQYDIRKILISLANSCAYVIGAGPHATRIIFMLKQRLIQRKRHEHNTQQCLVDMGFSRPKVQHALHINNNVYAAALEWLIENQSPTNLVLSDEQSPAMSLSSKFTNNNTIKDNIESLLEIIRIYCQRDVPPSSDMIQLIIDMGFDEATAREALKVTKNHQSYACEWLVGNRSKIYQAEQTDGLPPDSPILVALLASPHVQLSLSSPKMFIAYLSILEDYTTMSMWLSDNETSGIIGHILRTYHEEKHILAINQFSQQ